MTNWLKIRLTALMGGALLIGGATFLHAQNDYGPPAKTPAEAATNFFRLLSVFQNPRSAGMAEDEQSAARMVGSIEKSQFEALQSNSSGDAGEKVIGLLAEQATSQRYSAQVQSSSANQTIVSVSPNTQPKPREVVVIQEDGGYRVDIVATYARWNGLTGLDADKALFRETGWVSPTLGAQHEYMGAASLRPCQTNLKLIGLAIAQYSQDYDEHLPPARKWQNSEVLQPYLKDERLYTCPALRPKGNGYAFNSKLSQISLARIRSVSQTIQIYETSNPNPNVFAPFTGRAYRHTQGGKEGMNICFADGHAKWFSRGQSAQLTVEPQTATAGFVTVSTGGAR